jgi:hypothetical protein
MSEDEADEPPQREPIRIKLGQNLPENGCESLTTGHAMPRASVRFRMRSPGRTDRTRLDRWRIITGILGGRTVSGCD